MPSHPSTPGGVFESQEIDRLHRQILAAAGTRWDDWQRVSRTWLASPSAKRFHPAAVETLQRAFGGSERFVVRDPRICRLVPFWAEVARQAGVRPLWVHMHREPGAVAASLQHRNGMQPQYAHLLWLRHVLDAEAGTRGAAVRFFTSHERLMRDWASVRTRSALALGLDWEPLTDAATAEIDGFLDGNRARVPERPEAVPAGGRFSDWLRETFGVLERWSDAGEAPADYALLDRIRGELDALAPHAIPQREALPRPGDAGEGIGESGGGSAGMAPVPAPALPGAVEVGGLRREVRRLTTLQAETQKQAADLGRRLAVRLIGSVGEKVGSGGARPADGVPQNRLRLPKRLAVQVLKSLRNAKFYLNRERYRTARIIRKSGFLDEDWYLRTYPDVARNGRDPVQHYIEFGEAEQRDPSRTFNARWYRETYPDVALSGENTLVHHVKVGKALGRRTMPEAENLPWWLPLKEARTGDGGPRPGLARGAAGDRRSGLQRRRACLRLPRGGPEEHRRPLPADRDR